MSCTKIQILEIPEGTPSHFLTDGYLFLDLFDNEGLSLRKKPNSIDGQGKISDSAVLSFAVPRTPKNRFLLDHFVNPAVRRGQVSRLNVLATAGSAVIEENKLNVSSGNHNEYEVQLLRSSTHWLEAANRTNLASLEWGEFLFISQFVTQIQQNESAYNKDDGHRGIYFPLVNYGNFSKTNDHQVEDFRVWFHALYILQEAFCQLGYTFKAPVLENDFGRRLITYIADSDYGNNEGQREQRQFKATITEAPFGDNHNPMIFPNEIFDNGNNYSNFNGKFTGLGTHNFKLSIEVTARKSVSAGEGILQRTEFQIIKKFADGSETILKTGQIAFSDIIADTKSTYIEANQITIAAGDEVFVRHITTTDFLIIDSVEGSFENETTRTNYTGGDTIILSDCIDPDLTLLQYLKGIMHLFKARLVTNQATKEIEMMPSNDANLYGLQIDGYFLPFSEAQDITDKAVCESAKIELNETTKFRYKKIQYKKSTDDYIKQQLGDDADPPYTKTIDFGEQYQEKTVIDANPTFEASLSKEIVRTTLPNRQGIDMLQLLDNLDGEQSFNIGHRIALAAGDFNVRKLMPDGSEGILGYTMYGTEMAVPYAFMFTDYLINSLPTLYNIQYGNLGDYSLFELFWKKEIYSEFNNMEYNILTYLSPADYFALSFRKPVFLNYEGHPFFARIENVKDFLPCQDIATPLVLRPELGLISDCVDILDLPQEKCLNNKPSLSIASTQDATQRCATPTVGGSQGTTTGETLEYSTDGGTTWTNTTQGVQLCFANTTTSILFRYSTEYEAKECGKKSIVEFVNFDTLCSNEPSIVLDYDQTNNCITATGGGNINSAIDTDVWLVSVNGATAQPYNEGDLICSFTDIEFTRNLTYSDGCEASTTLANFTAPPPICDNQPEIICNFIKNSVTFEIGGTSNSEIYGVTFMFSQDSGTTWEIWNGAAIPCTGNLLVRASIHYCDCGIICIDKVCECTTPCDTSIVISYNETNDELIGVEQGCSSPIFRWQNQINGNWQNITGQSSLILANPTNGLYRLVSICFDGDNCNAISNIIEIDNETDCSGVSAILGYPVQCQPFTLIVNGCGTGTITYNYQMSVNGVWQSLQISTQQFNPSVNGNYRVIATCSNGCEATSNVVTVAFQDCTITASITENNGVLTASSNCAGVTSYTWDYSADGVSYSSLGLTTQSITTTQDGFYRANLVCVEDCVQCSAFAVFEVSTCTLPCNGDYVSRRMSEIEDHAWIIQEINAGNTVSFQMASFKINGVEQLTAPQNLFLNSSNITIFTSSIGQTTTSLTAWINSIISPFGFQCFSNGPASITSNTVCGYMMTIEYPACQTWSMEFTGAPFSFPRMDDCDYTQNGMTALYIGGNNELPTNQQGCGDYWRNRFSGTFNEQTGNNC